MIKAKHYSKIILYLNSLVVIGQMALAVDLEISEGAFRFSQLMKESTRQERKEMKHNEILAFVAQKRVNDMVTRDYFDVTDPDGVGMDAVVTLAGYPLPYGTDQGANHIALIAAVKGFGIRPGAAAEIVFNDFFSREDPASQHLFGETDFAKSQTHLGVGYAPPPGGMNSFGTHLFLIITAPAHDGNLSDHVIWLFERLSPSEIIEQDPDQDGISNLLEFAMNSDPLKKNTKPSIQLQKNLITGKFTLHLPFIVQFDTALNVTLYHSHQVKHPEWQIQQVFPLRNQIEFDVPLNAAGMFNFEISSE